MLILVSMFLSRARPNFPPRYLSRLLESSKGFPSFCPRNSFLARRQEAWEKSVSLKTTASLFSTGCILFFWTWRTRICAQVKYKILLKLTWENINSVIFDKGCFKFRIYLSNNYFGKIYLLNVYVQNFYFGEKMGIWVYLCTNTRVKSTNIHIDKPVLDPTMSQNNRTYE